MTNERNLTVFLPDTRGVEISRFGRGNLKIGAGVYTYSRLPGYDGLGTCPGSSDECEAICYAKRVAGPVKDVWRGNGEDDVPPIPGDCRLLRIHVSGDFDTKQYVANWIVRLLDRPDVTCWAYTRSWRVPELLPALEGLRALPHVELFASMDSSIEEIPPAGWRIAWIDGDWRADWCPPESVFRCTDRNRFTIRLTPTLVCPEETGHKRDCEACRYCFDGRRGDVTFLRH